MLGVNKQEARALTDSSTSDLLEVLRSADTPAEFLAGADAILLDRGNSLPMPVSLGPADSLSIAGNRAVDVENAPRVHDYLGEMDRANAADSRLWNYLAFVTYRQYMMERWPLIGGEGGKQDDTWKRRVSDRWLLPVGSVSRGRLVRHGIARLWWVAHLTYEPVTGAENVNAEKDPYSRTREVFKNEDRINAIFDREVGALANVTKAVLDHVSTHSGLATDKYVQRIMQYLTLTNGYRDLGALSADQLGELIGAASVRATDSKVRR